MGATMLKSAAPCRTGSAGRRQRPSPALIHCTAIVAAHQPSPAQKRMHAAIGHHSLTEKRWMSSFSMASARW